jgi:hypothetical protein
MKAAGSPGRPLRLLSVKVMSVIIQEAAWAAAVAWTRAADSMKRGGAAREGSSVGQADLREVQGDQASWHCHGDLREPQAQAETGLGGCDRPYRPSTCAEIFAPFLRILPAFALSLEGPRLTRMGSRHRTLPRGVKNRAGTFVLPDGRRLVDGDPLPSSASSPWSCAGRVVHLYSPIDFSGCLRRVLHKHGTHCRY